MNETTAKMDEIARYFREGDRLAKHLGIELLEVSPGRARARMELRDCHMNSVGVLHGGAYFTLADFAFAAASNSYGTIALALNVNISFLSKVERGTLYADAEEVDKNPKIGTYMVHITDEEGRLVALFQGMAYRKKDALPLA